MIKTFIIDDHTLVREALKKLLSESMGISVIGSSASGAEGIEQVITLTPDVLLLDYRLSDMTGLDVIQHLLAKDSAIKILMLTSIDNDVIPIKLLQAGARGFLNKDTNKNELVRAIKTIHVGQRFMDPSLSRSLRLIEKGGADDSLFACLSKREKQVAEQLIQGLSSKEMADRLQVSIKTIHSFKSHVFEKLAVKSDVELTLLALQHGLIEG